MNRWEFPKLLKEKEVLLLGKIYCNKLEGTKFKIDNLKPIEVREGDFEIYVQLTNLTTSQMFQVSLNEVELILNPC